jgi:glycosyltransferase involved in cell wall biosynthesis
MGLKILVSVLAFDEGKSGVADYIISVCKELSKNNQLELLIHKTDADIFPVRNKNISYRYVSEYLKRPFFSIFWHLYWLPFILSAKQYDLIMLPAGNRRLLARYPAQTVVTFHDLAQYHVPDRYDTFRMFYVKTIIPHYLRKAPIIMAISENTKNDLIKHYDLAPGRVEVNYNGYAPEKLKTNVSEAELRQVFKLTRPYILYNSRIEHPNKNHLHLIRAFELLPDEIRENYDLVFTGINAGGSEVIHDYARGSIAKKNIRFTGYVDEGYLGAFYKYAALYIFPSLYEGFGIPLLEAMASGIPVLCSNRSSLPEIGGDAVLTFDPEMHADIASKIMTVLTNPEQKAQMIARGLERVKLFSWKRHTNYLLELIKTEKNKK